MAYAGTPATTLKKTIARIQKASAEGAQIIGLQELFATNYFCQTYDHDHFKLAQSIPGPVTEALSKVAKKEGVVIIAPVFEKRAEGIYHNSAVVIDADGSIAGKYRKMHIPDDPHFYEKFYFAPGDLGFNAFQTKYAKIGILICWDQWFPEAARLTALAGAQIIFYPTAIGWHESEPKEVAKKQLEGWQVIQRGHAVANEVFIAATNRVGKEGPVTFWGHSFISDPFGHVIAEAGQTAEQNLMATCDLSEIENTRQAWPFLRDRRIDAYGGISERFLDKEVPTKI